MTAESDSRPGKLKKILTRKMLSILFLGLASGVPLGVVLTLIQTWFTDANISLKTIGLLSLVQFPYTFKFLWSPFMDRFRMPFLGKRQGWMLLAQIGMFLSVAALALFSPKKDVLVITIVSIMISFFGASHDIVIDAYRRDILDEDELGFGSALSTNAYLIGYRFLATVLGLALADLMSWSHDFLILASLCLIGIIGTFVAPEPTREVAAPKSVKEAVVLPFLNYLSRTGAVEILIFILIYNVGNNFAGNLLTTFYLKIGYTKTEIAYMGKIVGFTAMFLGGFAGGALLFRYSIKKCLYWFGWLQALSILGFAAMNELVPRFETWRMAFLGGVVGFENLTIGMSMAAYSAFLLKLCDRRFSATQLALFTSFMGIPRVFIPGWAGYIAQPFGWTKFFIFSFLIALPGIAFVYFRADKWDQSMPEYG